MPLFPLLRIIASRVIVGIIALFTAFGLGSVSDSPTYRKVQENPLEKLEELVLSFEELLTFPIKTPAPFKENPPASGENTKEIETPAKTIPKEPEEPLEETILPPAKEEEVALVDPPVTETEPSIPFSQINTETAKTLVNVLCSQNAAGTVAPITGSGVIIDPRGVVITNAHVAQFFLLKDFPTKDGLTCILRAGSPARALYTAELLYISSEWVSAHARDIRDSEPEGTGEHDYAFLRITGRTDPHAELPTTFPFVPIDINDRALTTGNRVLLAAYPAGFLGNISIQTNLHSVSSIATIGERFTFFENTIDLFSIGGTVVSQGGSSGGAVVSDTNKLIGIIVTTTQADTTAKRDLRAITLGHINRSLLEDTNAPIEGLLFGDIALKAKLFNVGVAPSLTALFLKQLVQ